MDKKDLVIRFWQDVVSQRAENLKAYFLPNATINWHNTNEQFSVEEYIIANCEYPGNWCGSVEKIELTDDLVITATRVWNADNGHSFHAVSFFKLKHNKIICLDEYWGDDGLPPQWRLNKFNNHLK